MIPFPKELIALFPFQGRIPERPWWNTVHQRVVDNIVANIVAFGPAEVERIDQEHPLPFPGIRPGQIWALVYNDSKSPLETIHINTAMVEHGVRWISVSRGATCEDFNMVSYQNFLCVSWTFKAFLIADPCGYAPWAPGEYNPEPVKD